MFRASQTNLELTAQDRQLLKETKIGVDGPGSILHDFHVLLDYVIVNRPAVTKNHQLPLKALDPLNEQMTRPLQHGLTRPLQKSLPHINGLYLILRASGLTFVDTTGKKPKLMVDDAVLQSWQSLSPTEQYFTLLESWLFRGTKDILGEHSSGFGWYRLPLERCLSLFQHLPPDGYTAPANADAIDGLRYFPELHNLALLELFGLVTVEHGTAVAKEGWQIKSVRSLPLGDILLKLFLKEIFEFTDLMVALDHPAELRPGTIQPLIQPYFPEWQNNLQWPEHAFREGLYIFKVSVFKDVWRRIAVPGQFALDQLASAILRAFNFDNDHLYRFIYQTPLGTEESIYHSYMDEGPFTSEVRVGNVPLNEGASMFFNFDFGDDWYFEVALEAIEDKPTVKKTTVLESHGEAPEQYPSYDDEW
jgi:hypothetical protein